MGVGQRLVLLFQLLEQSHVLDGDDSLIGEGLDQRDLLFGEGPHLASMESKGTNESTFLEHGNRERSSHALTAVHLGRRKGRVREDVGHMTRPQLQTDSPEWCLRTRHDGRFSQGGQEFVRPLRCPRNAKSLAVKSEASASWGVTKAKGIRQDRVEHRLQARWRARDDPKDFGGCRLLLERLGHLSMSLRERTVLLLQFRK